MTGHQLTSPLAGDIASFIGFKHATGVRFISGEYCLWRLDRYLAGHGLAGLTRPAVEGFIADHETGRNDPDRSWLAYLRGFGRYLQTRGEPDVYVLPPGYGNTRRRPATYLLSQTEIDAFFEAATRFKHQPPWGWQAKAFFGLMLACGLRTCEARRLDRADIDHVNGSIDIRWSKGPRSRRLPTSPDVSAMLAACDRRNDVFAPGRTPFFISGWRQRVAEATTGVVFKRIWADAGLAIPTLGPKPRPYDLRHHFAYANIDRWHEQGRNAEAMLPYLSRYMGHASIESTIYYLHVSPDFLAGYTAAAAASSRLLPKAGFDD